VGRPLNGPLYRPPHPSQPRPPCEPDRFPRCRGPVRRGEPVCGAPGGVRGGSLRAGRVGTRVEPASALAPPPAALSLPGHATLTPHGVARLDIEAHAGASWISVVDAKGISQAARMLTQGERFTLEQPEAPLRLVLGNAPALRLSWRGQPQALDAHTAARVARLELK
jgi:hypothetical protein